MFILDSWLLFIIIYGRSLFPIKKILSFTICNNFYLFINIYIWDINPYYDIVTVIGTFHILSDIYINYLLIIIYDKDIES
jgi:hypothetical protein